MADASQESPEPPIKVLGMVESVSEARERFGGEKEAVAEDGRGIEGVLKGDG